MIKTILLLALLCTAQDAPFNGKDFRGWTFFLEEKDYNAGGKGRISDFAKILPGGVIEITPKLHGALMTEKDYLNYKLHAENGSLWNTAPTFPIYVVSLVTKWLLTDIGGLANMEAQNEAKAKLLYDVVDASNGFYKGHAQPNCR